VTLMKDHSGNLLSVFFSWRYRFPHLHTDTDIRIQIEDLLGKIKNKHVECGLIRLFTAGRFTNIPMTLPTYLLTFFTAVLN